MSTRRFIVARVRDDARTKARILRELALENINIEGFTTHNGELYLLADFPDKALEILADLGVSARDESVLQLKLPNERGALSHVFDLLDTAGVRTQVSFGFAGIDSQGPIFLVVDDIETAEQTLQRSPMRPAMVLYH